MTTLNIRELVGLSHLAPTKCANYYLIGVHVNVSAGLLRLEATDGRCLGEFISPVEITPEPIDIIIPLDVIKQFKITKKTPDYCTLTVDGDRASITLESGATFPFTPIDGIFPDCQQILDASVKDNEPANFDFELLAKFTKLGKTLGLENPGMFMIEHRGANPAIVTNKKLENFRGAIAPFKL